MKITFWGAAEQVTGAMFLLETADGYRLLVDCGINLERRKGNYPANHALFPIDPALINAVLLTHAHLDHSGNIPNLYKHHFEGKILATLPTYYLTQLLLTDAANLNEGRLNQKAVRNSQKLRKTILAYDDFYLYEQVKATAEHFVIVPFKKTHYLNKYLRCTYYEAGHLLGAAHIVVEYFENDTWKSIGFSGDLGRKNYPLLVDPTPMPPVDYLVCEATYGGRYHQTQETTQNFLAQLVQQTCVNKPGRLIIPAFSIGRSQAILFTLQQLSLAGILPKIPVYLDSPLAYQSTLLYQNQARFLNKEANALLANGGQLFDFDQLQIVENPEQSKLISNHFEPCIIVSSSGMLEGGRIQFHISQNISNPYATMLMVGYSVPGTLGHKLVQGINTLAINGKSYPVNAQVVHTDAFSGHGDQADLLAFVQYQNTEKLKKIFLVHGDTPALLAFKAHLAPLGYSQTLIPKQGQTCFLP